MPWTHDTRPVLFNKGPLIVNIESVFFHWHRYPKRRVAPETPPLHEPARPREVEQPYRSGVGHVLRLPLTRRGVVVGYWLPAGEAVLEEEESGRLMQAVEGAMVPGITATEISQWSRGKLPWWARLLERWRQWLAPLATGDPQVPLEDDVEQPDDTGVIPWDGKVYDLEDARVDLKRAE